MSGIQKVGIIGAGQMGSGIAHVCALSGMDVVLQDLSMDKVKEGLATISGNMTRQASKDIIKEAEIKPALARIQASDSYENMADCDLVIESATEDETIKRKILSQLAPVVKSDSILPPTHPPFRSPAWPPRPTGPKSSSASIL
jgi:3-hydroxybutyryl-CoA dehydrogenase